MYYKFINEAGELCGLACGGDPETDGAERIEITEEEYNQLMNDLLLTVTLSNNE